MRTLAFDGRMGASGDMLLGALLALGADPDELTPVETALDVEYAVDTTTKCGIEATDVRVLRTDDDHEHEPEESHDHGHDHAPEKSHDHGHGATGSDHDHAPEKSHDHGHGATGSDHGHAEGTGPHRSYEEVIEIVDSLSVPDGVADTARESFRLLGEAEAAVHGTTLSETRFHEVGADDAIADVVGVSLLLADLDPDRVVTTPLAAGGGIVEMSHGRYPVPTPAVVKVAERADWSLRGGPIERELLTPTGAAILAAVAEGIERLPPMAIERSGYGAGDGSFSPDPNVLRALSGETTAGLTRERVSVLETNVDDVTPEELGGLQETLSDAGALDVTAVPATMKKSRPGHLLKIITRPEHADRVARRLAEETGTLGVREAGGGHRLVADRELQTVTVDVAGESVAVDVKVASIDGEVFDVSAEFDDTLAAAADSEVPVRELRRRAEAAVHDRLD